MEYVKDHIVDYLSKRKFLTLATSTPNDGPLAHPIAYVNKEDTVYFSTGKETRKFKNIQKNPNVAYSVFDQTEYMDEARSIQMQGIATEVTDKKEIDEVNKMLKQKFPAIFLDEFTKELDTVILKITPKACHFIDYTKGFAFRDSVKY
jgi:nitroimidazol reductase NimA-like FMN-containing flavoprotein (pyridoxamine 5'-phosphate oxidase superfamily)